MGSISIFGRTPSWGAPPYLQHQDFKTYEIGWKAKAWKLSGPFLLGAPFTLTPSRNGISLTDHSTC